MAHDMKPMPLESWKDTRDTLQNLAQIVGAVRQADTPKQQHWFHISLRVGAQGLVTPPIPSGNEAFELRINLVHHRIEILVSNGGEAALAIPGHNVSELVESLKASLARLGVGTHLDWSTVSAPASSRYDTDEIAIFWNNLVHVHRVFSVFKGGLRGRTGPVQLWPHHFDLALLWFTGRTVPGTNLDDEEASEEQMNFGFSTGDESIPKPYFYVTAYPFPDELSRLPLSFGAYWNDAWKGVVLPLDKLVARHAPEKDLLSLLQAVQTEGARLMR